MNKKFQSLLITICSLSSIFSFGQWSILTTNNTSTVTEIVADGSNIFAATSGNYVLFSNNNGNSWSVLNGGLNAYVNALAVSGSTLIAGTGSGIYLSYDNGVSWGAANLGFGGTKNIKALTVRGSEIYAGTSSSGIYRSLNNAQNWSAVNSGLLSYTIMRLAVSSTSIFAGTQGQGLVMSSDGTVWNPMNSGISNTVVAAIGVGPSDMMVSTTHWSDPPELLYSTNGANSWNNISAVIPSTLFANAIAINGNNAYVGTYGGGVYKGPVSGGTWYAENSGLTSYTITAMRIIGTDIFAGTLDGKIFRRALSDISTGIHELKAEALNFYPNPASTKINIESASSNNISYSLRNTVGDELKSGIITIGAKKQISVEDVPAGMYFLQYTQGNSKATQKIVIEK